MISKLYFMCMCLWRAPLSHIYCSGNHSCTFYILMSNASICVLFACLFWKPISLLIISPAQCMTQDRATMHFMEYLGLIDMISGSITKIIQIQSSFSNFTNNLVKESDAFTKQICIALKNYWRVFGKNKWSGKGVTAAAVTAFRFKCLSVTLLK